MERFWAPWRGEYITGSVNEKTGQCILCGLAGEKPSKKNLVLFKNDKVYVVMNKFPYNNGHIMVVPNQHVDTLSALPGEDYISLSAVLKKSVEIINRVYKPEGCNIGMNIGRAAGAGIDSHIHYHVVPRWNGDTNFMPVFSEVKVISEHFVTTYEKLSEEFMEVMK
ncbi:MAG: HIT domain-containing protein [Oligoflexia bacterium]|nr:HIT domain-containing protein [Oligoflexia bacterium]